MSNRYNNAGRELVVDRVIELKRRGSATVSTISQAISSQTQMKDLQALKDAIAGITSDGIITSYEKQGLRREWASLQNSYTTIAEQFTSDESLKDNPSFVSLRQAYLKLSAIMDKVFADMSTDYVGDDVKEISDDFYSIYELLTVCQTILNGINDFARNYSIIVSGSREALDGTLLTAGIYRGGVEQMNPEFIDGTNYTWRRVDEPDEFTPQHGKSITIDSDDLPVSPCRFSVTWADAEEQEASLSIVFELEWGTIIEYAWSNALTSEELQGMMPSAWSELPPVQPEDKQYLWRRESKDNGKTWQYFRENGENGGAPKYFYKYTKTDDPNAWKGGGVIFSHRNKLLAVGSTLLTVGMAGWLDHVPQGEQYRDDFLWTKIVHADGTVDIIPPAQKGEDGKPAQDIRIVASNDTYQLSTRGMVLEDMPFTFALERWYVTGEATWTIDPDPATVASQLRREPSDDPDILKVTVLAGAELPSFLVSVTCEGVEITRDLRIMGVDGGEESPWYFKVYPLNADGAKPTYNRETGIFDPGNSVWPEKSPEGQLIEGDYILYLTTVYDSSEDTEGHVEPIPYYFVPGESELDDGHWEMLDEDSPYYSEAMGTMLADVVRMPDMPVTVGAMYGFFENLAAYNAFITNLFTHSIELQNKDGEIGDIHSQGYYRGAYLNPDIKSGFYLGADGYAELFKVILRDATIVSQDNSGDVIFSIGQVSDPITFSHTETPTTKSFDDLFGNEIPKTGTLTISGEQYTFGTEPSTITNGCSIGTFMVYDDTPLEFTTPYAGSLELSGQRMIGSVGTATVSVDGNQRLNFDVDASSGDTYYTLAFSSGSTVVISTTVPGLRIRMRGKTFPDICGGVGSISYYEETLTHLDVFILIAKEDSAGFMWPYSAFKTKSVPASTTTGIVYDGQSFDQMNWRIGDATSTLVAQMLQTFVEGQVYTCSSGSTITEKGSTRTIDSLVINGKVLTVMSGTRVYTYQDGIYAKSASITTTDMDGAVVVKSILPVSSSTYTQIGANGNRFDDIYCGTLHANNLDASYGIKVLYSGIEFETYNGNSYSIQQKTFTLYENRFCEYSARVYLDGSSSTYYTNFVYGGKNLSFDSDDYTLRDGYVISVVPEDPDNNITVGSSLAKFVMLESSKAGYVSLSMRGILDSTSFNEIRSALGI